MSVYSDISKSIGWDKQDVSIPSLVAASELCDKVLAGDLRAFRRAFKICRFAPTPTTNHETEAMRDIAEAVQMMAEYWRTR